MNSWIQSSLDGKNKLKDNLLSIKYSKNEAPHSQLRPRSISTALRGLIEDVIANNYNEKVYQMLEDDDKRTFKKIVKVLKLPIDTYDDLDKEYQKNYELLKGQFMSGNNSPEVKNALRKYIVEGMNEGKLNRSEAMFLLYQLSLWNKKEEVFYNIHILAIPFFLEVYIDANNSNEFIQSRGRNKK